MQAATRAGEEGSAARVDDSAGDRGSGAQSRALRYGVLTCTRGRVAGGVPAEGAGVFHAQGHVFEAARQPDSDGCQPDGRGAPHAGA